MDSWRQLAADTTHVASSDLVSPWRNGSWLAAVLAVAPLQCPSPQHPVTAREESPADALWLLASQFGREDNPIARERTLRFLVDRYPNSRQAERARIALSDHDAGD